MACFDVSVIIPIYNEERMLRENAYFYKDLSQKAELLFVDGGSTDASVRIASQFARVLTASRGRAVQMNYGARHASKSHLFFLHSDSVVALSTLDTIEAVLREGLCIGGCLHQRINKKGFLFRAIAGFGNVRAKLTKVFYGDQGLFITKNAFFSLNGFSEVPIMEDVLFTRRLRRHGTTTVLPDVVTVSARRWEKRGVFKLIVLYSIINVLFYLRVSPFTLQLLYDDVR